MSVNGFGGRARVCLCAATMILALQGCGGGGGGGGGSSDPSTPIGPGIDTPLALSTGNFAAVSMQGLRIPEAVLKVGQHAVSEVMRIARNGSLQMDVKCSDISVAHYGLTDADGNGVPSAGDSLQIDYSRCSIDYLDGVFTGTVVIRLTSVDDAQHGAVSGTIDFGAGLAPMSSAQGKWLGTVNFNRTVTVLGEQLNVDATAADDLRRVYRLPRGASSIDQREAYRQLHLARSLRRDVARMGVSGSLVLASELLGGRVDIAIDPTMGGYLATYPDTGSARITGAANSRITLPADPAGGASLMAQLDANGDGAADGSATISWGSTIAGFLWSEQNNAMEGSLSVRNDAYLMLISKPDFIQTRGVDLSQPLRLQFNRPVDAGTVLYARLEDHGAMYDGQYGTTRDLLSDEWPVVAADVSVQGAMILIRPQAPLRDGHFYQLLVSNIGDFVNAQAVTVRGADGLAQINLDVQASVFNTDDMLWAAVSGAGTRSVVMPNRPVTLTATMPLATSMPLRYQWTQLSGPTLVLGAPNGASTSVQWADAGATGIGRAMLQLTVTDNVGRTSITPVEMQVANLESVTTSLYFQSEAGDFIGGGKTRVYSPQTGTFTTDTTRGYLTVAYTDVVPGVGWSLQLRAPGDGVPPVGSYNNAVDMANLQTVSAEMNFGGSGSDCGLLAGNFQVLELQLDGTGVVQRLAVDFDQTCTQSNTPAPLRGSIRINSSLPIRP